MDILGDAGTVISWILNIFFLFVFGGIVFRFYKNKRSPVKEVDAEVIKKECFAEATIKGVCPPAKEHYIITFLCGGKRLVFDVSEYSYGNYCVGDRGKLQYRGNVILDFK